MIHDADLERALEALMQWDASRDHHRTATSGDPDWDPVGNRRDVQDRAETAVDACRDIVRRADGPSNGICLDADSVRAEVEEAYSEKAMDAINSLTDAAIDRAISSEVGDDFWQQYDDVRSRTITLLLMEANLDSTEERTI